MGYYSRAAEKDRGEKAIQLKGDPRQRDKKAALQFRPIWAKQMKERRRQKTPSLTPRILCKEPRPSWWTQKPSIKEEPI